MDERQEDAVGDIHNSAMQVAQQAYLCTSNKRVSKMWLAQMKHSAQRIVSRLDQLESEL